MQVQVESARPLVFDDGRPVRAASALAPLGDGWLVAQDDATAAAWLTPAGVRELRLFPPVEGMDVFSEADGTKHLKPDLEAACGLPLDGGPGVLLLGSGATERRRRMVLVSEGGGTVQVGELAAFYDLLALALDVGEGQLNIEGVARNGAVLRCYQRGNAAAGVPNGSVDVALPALVEAVRGRADPGQVPMRRVLRYELGTVGGVGLAATDAVALPDGRVLLSAAAEDTPDPVADGPVLGGAFVLLDDDRVVDTVALPQVDGAAPKVEGLAVREVLSDGLRLLAVVDADDPLSPSVALELRLTWSSSGSAVVAPSA